VKPVLFWHMEIENRPGALAGVLEHLRGVDLQIVMGYRYTGNRGKGAVELFPVRGKKAAQAAQAAGLSESTLPALLVQADNRAGLGHAMTKALADAGINLDFLVAQVIGKRSTSVLGFDTPDDARKAVAVIKKAVRSRR